MLCEQQIYHILSLYLNLENNPSKRTCLPQRFSINLSTTWGFILLHLCCFLIDRWHYAVISSMLLSLTFFTLYFDGIMRSTGISILFFFNQHFRLSLTTRTNKFKVDINTYYIPCAHLFSYMSSFPTSRINDGLKCGCNSHATNVLPHLYWAWLEKSLS